MRKWQLLIGLVFISLVQGMSQDNCNISFTGSVIDNHDDTALVGAVVELGNQVIVSDQFGKFEFQNICSGNYSIKISHLECDDFVDQIELTKSQSKTFYLEHHEELIQEIIISRTAKRGELSKASSTQTGEELDEKKGGNFGDLLEGVRGVSLLKTGSTISKPVINGLHSQRILLINNDMRMEGQQWGSEHAPEIDPYAVQSLSVISGAGSVEYGADGIGGVILVEPKHLPDAYGITINPQLAAFSNGRGGSISTDIYGKKKIFGLPLSFEAQGSLKKQGNLKSPDYYLDNTGEEEGNFQFRVGYIGDQFQIIGKVSQYNSKLGILTDSHIGNETDLLAIIENGRPFVDRGFSYDILRPRQDILHEIDQIEAFTDSKIGQWQFSVSRQYNRRSEFDRSETEPGLNLKTETFSSSLALKHQLAEGWNGKIGTQWQNQDYRYNGFYLIPEYKQNSLGFYLFEQVQIHPKITAEAGIRYDKKDFTYFIPYKEFRRLDDSNLLYNEINGDIGVRKNKFNNLWSGSSGLTFNATDRLSFSSYAGYGSRQPLPNELYSDGVHHGTALWEVGNPNLEVEHSLNIQANANYESSTITAEFNGYLNSISNFTYMLPNQDFDPIFTIRGSFPVYETIQNDAQFIGSNYSVNLPIKDRYSFSTTGSFLLAKDKQLDDYLLFMPANRLNHQFRAQLSDHWETTIGLQNVFKQNRIPNPDTVADYVLPPDGYSLWNTQVQYTGTLIGHSVTTSLFAENILNKTYKDYLDRYRYFADSPGLNIGFRFNYLINSNF